MAQRPKGVSKRSSQELLEKVATNMMRRASRVDPADSKIKQMEQETVVEITRNGTRSMDMTRSQTPLSTEQAFVFRQFEQHAGSCVRVNEDHKRQAEALLPGLSFKRSSPLLEKFFILGQRVDDGLEAISLTIRELMQLLAQNDVNTPDEFGCTVLHEAARIWSIRTCRILIKHQAAVNIQDNFGWTPLHIAAALDRTDIVRLLLDNLADTILVTRNENMTALHFAARANAHDSARLIIDKDYKRSLELRDVFQRTPLHIAAEYGNVRTCRVLLSKKADPSVADITERKAMMWMVRKMPAVAKEALDFFYTTDNNLKQREFKIGALIEDVDDPSIIKDAKSVDEESSDSFSMLEVIVHKKSQDLLMHPVIRKLIAVKWNDFARSWALFYLFMATVQVALWSIFGLLTPAPVYRWDFKANIVRIILFVLLIAFWIHDAWSELKEYHSSHKELQVWKKSRLAWLVRIEDKIDTDRWKAEKTNFLGKERHWIEVKAKPDYLIDKWNGFDVVCLLVKLVSLILYGYMIIIGPGWVLTARWQLRITAIAIILSWVNLLKNIRVFQIMNIGPFVVMLGEIGVDIIQFSLIYLEFFAAFGIAFWMLYGNSWHLSEVDRNHISDYGYPASVEIPPEVELISFIDGVYTIKIEKNANLSAVDGASIQKAIASGTAANKSAPAYLTSTPDSGNTSSVLTWRNATLHAGFDNIESLVFDLFRITVGHDYEFERLKEIDEISTYLLVSVWIYVSAVICFNMFVALLSNTFQRVFDNAKCVSVLQQAITIVSLEDRLDGCCSWMSHCKIPGCGWLTCFMDDDDRVKKGEQLDRVIEQIDMFDDDEDDLNKVTIQIKEQLDDMQEQLDRLTGGHDESDNDIDGTEREEDPLVKMVERTTEKFKADLLKLLKENRDVGSGVARGPPPPAPEEPVEKPRRRKKRDKAAVADPSPNPDDADSGTRPRPTAMLAYTFDEIMKKVEISSANIDEE